MCHFHHLSHQLAGLSITIASLLMSPALSGLQRVCFQETILHLSFNLIFGLCWKELPLVTIQESVIKEGGDGTLFPSWDSGRLDEWFHLVSSYQPKWINNHLTKYLHLQVRPKDGYVDHCLLPQCSPGCGGCLPAGWQALCCGWIWWPVISEHCGVLRCPEQWVDWGNQSNLMNDWSQSHNVVQILHSHCFRFK